MCTPASMCRSQDKSWEPVLSSNIGSHNQTLVIKLTQPVPLPAEPFYWPLVFGFKELPFSCFLSAIFFLLSILPFFFL